MLSNQPDKRIHCRRIEYINVTLHPLNQRGDDPAAWHAGCFEQSWKGRLPVNNPTAQAGQVIDDDRHKPLAAPMTDGRRLMPILDASGKSLSKPIVAYPI
jgi:hypothetical protein